MYSTYSLILHCKIHAKNVATLYYMCHLLKVSQYLEPPGFYIFLPMSRIDTERL